MSKNNFLHLFIKSFFFFTFRKYIKLPTGRTKKENKENRKVFNNQEKQQQKKK